MSFNQAIQFLIFTVDGFCIGVLFDLFRIIRKNTRVCDFVTYIHDILFCILTGIIFLYSMCRFCDGKLRWFMFFGCMIGVSLYMIIFSRFIIFLFTVFINVIKKIIKKIYKILYFVFFPIFGLFNMINSFFSRFIKKAVKKCKNIIQKRGFLTKKENNII